MQLGLRIERGIACLDRLELDYKFVSKLKGVC